MSQDDGFTLGIMSVSDIKGEGREWEVAKSLKNISSGHESLKNTSPDIECIGLDI